MLSGPAFEGENLASLAAEIGLQSIRLEELWLLAAPPEEREAALAALESAAA
jgi:hypothetical protein